MKKLFLSLTGALAIILLPATVLAHVIVTPDTADVGAYTTFNISVPNEKDQPMTTLKLDIPAELGEVTPTQLAGWTISTDGSGEDITSVTWTGELPAHQRVDFSFRTQAPAKEGELIWKAHQTYADGSTVNWDQKPSDKDDEEGANGPYSVTQIKNDLAEAESQDVIDEERADTRAGLALVLSIVALGLSAFTFVKRKS